MLSFLASRCSRASGGVGDPGSVIIVNLRAAGGGRIGKTAGRCLCIAGRSERQGEDRGSARKIRLVCMSLMVGFDR